MMPYLWHMMLSHRATTVGWGDNNGVLETLHTLQGSHPPQSSLPGASLFTSGCVRNCKRTDVRSTVTVHRNHGISDGKPELCSNEPLSLHHHPTIQERIHIQTSRMPLHSGHGVSSVNP